jgi:hypothetical protein
MKFICSIYKRFSSKTSSTFAKGSNSIAFLGEKISLLKPSLEMEKLSDEQSDLLEIMKSGRNVYFSGTF